MAKIPNPGILAAEWRAAMSPIVNYRGDLYQFEAGAYRPLERAAVEKCVYDFVVENFGAGAAQANYIKAVVDAVQMAAFLNGGKEPPFWIDGRACGMQIAFANGLFDVDSLTLQQHDPYYFTTNKLSHDCDLTATCQQWERAVSNLKRN